MQFFTGITKLASRPPWSAEHEIDGQKGYWAETGTKNHPVFLRSKDNRIHLPKTLRGKSITDIRQEDLDSLDKTDSGHTHYGLWKKDFDRKSDNDKIYDGYHFNAYGLVLLERLKRFFAKNNLNDVTQLGLDNRYSIDLGTFDTLTQCTDIHKVQRIGRTLAKKYRMIIELLKSQNKSRLATKLDRDFYYNWDKLENFFDFDAAGYKPSAPDKVEEEPEEEMQQTSELVRTKDEFIDQANHLIHPQMAGFIKAMNQFDKAVNSNDMAKAKQTFQTMNTELMRILGMSSGDVGNAAQEILHLPAMVLLHHKLFSEKN